MALDDSGAFLIGGIFTAVYKTRQEKLNDYDGFVDKFKPKKTTDDCYTPPNIYDAVKQYAIERYGLYDRDIVRPFWPGGDYESYDYPDGCVVIDNPPFSIISKICRDYIDWGVDFFLFAPHLTNFSIKYGNHIICGVKVTYENGAEVATSFITNLGEDRAETAPILYRKLEEANKNNRKSSQPRYQYPDELLTVNDMAKLCKAGIFFRLRDVEPVERLDMQKSMKKSIYGKGFFISRERAKFKRERLKQGIEEAIVFTLSEREQQIVDRLGGMQ